MKQRILYGPENNPIWYQRRFHFAKKRFAYLSTGFGGGKTYSLCHKAFWLMNINRGTTGGLLVPSYKMYKRDVIPTFEEIFELNRMRAGKHYRYNKSEMIWTFPGTKTHLYVFPSGDKGDSIRGPNLGWGLINEITMCHEMAFKHFLARMRDRKAKLNQIAVSGTPEGFNWTYDFFIETPRADTDLIFGSSKDNVYNAESYISDLESSYDEKMRQQYIDGKFVNILGNTVAWSFDRAKHTASGLKKVEGCPVWVTIDFNVNPMSATLWSYVETGFHPLTGQTTGRRLVGWKSIKLENSNTYALCDEIKRYLSPDDDVVVYPDPAGRARDTRSRNSRSDFDILREKGFTNIKHKSRPNVRSGLLALNNLLDSGNVTIDIKECKDLVADLEQCVFIEAADRFEIDKRNQHRSHWLDGFKNMVEIEFPIKVDRSGFRQESYL